MRNRVFCWLSIKVFWYSFHLSNVCLSSLDFLFLVCALLLLACFSVTAEFRFFIHFLTKAGFSSTLTTVRCFVSLGLDVVLTFFLILNGLVPCTPWTFHSASANDTSWFRLSWLTSRGAPPAWMFGKSQVGQGITAPASFSLGSRFFRWTDMTDYSITSESNQPLIHPSFSMQCSLKMLIFTLP